VTETEIKLHWDGTAEEARALLGAHGYALAEPRIFEDNQLFDLASGRLQESDQVLRLRITSSPAGHTRAMVTYKGPAAREIYKSREEIEFEVSDAVAFVLVLHRLGYRRGFRYEKFRSTFRGNGEPGLLTIDQVPIGIYLELEGPQDWIDIAANRLGFSRDKFLTASYASLYGQYREQHPSAPADMTFDLESPYISTTKTP